MTKIEIGEDELYLILRKIHAYKFANTLAFSMKLLSSFSFTKNRQRVECANVKLLEMNLVDKDYKVDSEAFKLIKKITQNCAYIIRREANTMLKSGIAFDYIYWSQYGAVSVLANDKNYSLWIASPEELTSLLLELIHWPSNYKNPEPIQPFCVENKVLAQLIPLVQNHDLEGVNKICKKNNLSDKDIKKIVAEMYNAKENIVYSIYKYGKPFKTKLVRILISNDLYYLGDKKTSDKYTVILSDDYTSMLKEMFKL